MILLVVQDVYSHASGVTEDTALTITPDRPVILKSIYFDLTNLTENTYVRVKYAVDVANLRNMETYYWQTAMDVCVYFRNMAIASSIRFTFESSVAEGAARDIEYQYILEV